VSSRRNSIRSTGRDFERSGTAPPTPATSMGGIVSVSDTHHRAGSGVPVGQELYRSWKFSRALGHGLPHSGKQIWRCRMIPTPDG
jgi:hypothetical protein